MVDFPQQLVADHLRVGQHFVAGEDLRAGHVLGFEGRDPLRRGAGPHDVADHAEARVRVRDPARRRVVPLVLQPFEMAGGPRHALPLGVRDRGRRDVAVGRPVDQVAGRPGPAMRDLAADEDLAHEALGPDEGDRRVEHGEVQVLALARPFAREQRRGDRLRRGQAGHLVRDDRPHHLRLAGAPVGLDVGEARQRLDDRVVHALLGVRSFLPEAADRHVDQARVQLAQALGAQPQLVDDAGPEVLDEDVGRADQVVQDREAALLLQVEDEGALAAVDRREARGDAATLGSQPAHDVAARRRLDLDDFGALVRQQHGGDRRRDHRRQLDHPVAVEGAHGGAGYHRQSGSVAASRRVLFRSRRGRRRTQCAAPCVSRNRRGRRRTQRVPLRRVRRTASAAAAARATGS